MSTTPPTIPSYPPVYQVLQTASQTPRTHPPPTATYTYSRSKPTPQPPHTMKFPTAFTVVFTTLTTLTIALPSHPHAGHHTPVDVNSMSRFDCVKDCWRSHYGKIEGYNQRQFCHSHLYNIEIHFKHRVLPCIKQTCDHSHKSEILYESREWFCNFCGWLPDDAGVSC
ncbi:hypothetical protein P171DRAFT_448926 [Karstenula rhodostoma CBS 690.94]|uniref:Uncharacterized protein n=1 Tax=Karstenula rhodostoma CBS 690.94 TaxID=1392251 RepID=A0A9P4U5B6_9PLEO|nr:hypothetical protein P171DRAFT_448926 [Karstenula rhodostoma CBS 690.94]